MNLAPADDPVPRWRDVNRRGGGRGPDHATTTSSSTRPSRRPRSR